MCLDVELVQGGEGADAVDGSSCAGEGEDEAVVAEVGLWWCAGIGGGFGGLCCVGAEGVVVVVKSKGEGREG